MIKFGTDGWRGVIAKDFTFDNVKIISQAVADYLRKGKKGKKKIVIGYDSRFLSEEFALTAASVLTANKIEVTLSDKPVPTPVVSLHSLINHYDLGIMITASHNPPYFNGLKIKTKEGAAADNCLTNKVEKLLYKSKPKFIEPNLAEKRGLFKLSGLTDRYINFLRRFVNVKEINKLSLNILVDTMYGVGDKFVERVLGKGRLKIDYLHNESNPSFGGIQPEPIEKNLKELIKNMRRGKYDLGVALDGDGDRIAVIDRYGNFLGAQTSLPLLAIHMIKNRKERGGIGKTVVGSNLIDRVALALNIACYETPIGFKYISNLFKEDLICLGGEEAGGIGFKGYIPERDGSASFLMLLEMLALQGQSLETLLKELYKKYGKWHYRRIAIPLRNVRRSLAQMKLPSRLYGRRIERINTLDGIKLITSGSWLMFRRSGTEPIVRVYAESQSKKEVDKLLSLGKKMIYAL